MKAIKHFKTITKHKFYVMKLCFRFGLYKQGLLHDLSKYTWSEFATLLSGLMPDTPLGQIISIRAEKDKEIIKRFTKDQKRIQSDWKRRQSKNVDKESYEDAMNAFKNMFISMANSK